MENKKLATPGLNARGMIDYQRLNPISNATATFILLRVMYIGIALLSKG